VAQLVVSQGVLRIATISAVRTGPGSANVTIKFTAPGSPALSAFTLVSSSILNGSYTAVNGAVITAVSDGYQATFSTNSTSFYKIEQTSP
jgi:hypothetical protein